MLSSLMGRISTCGFMVGVTVSGWTAIAEAGGTRAAPAVRVIAPGGASGIALEPDDLPAPQLEVVKHPIRIDLPAIPPFEARAANASSQLEIELDMPVRPPMRRHVDDRTLDGSIGHLNACTKAIAARQHQIAIAECRAATEVWPDNHLAWYAWASAHLARQEWSEAKAAAEHAVTLRPDRAMYQLYHGIALYEAERRLGAARDALTTAVRLEPALWRAHYYLGRIYRDLGDARRAAEQFSATIRTHPGYRFAYIALCELYRGRDRVEQALAVAQLGAANVPAAEAAELWIEVGIAHEATGDAGALDRAIEAYGRALATKPGDALAKLQRGQLHLRRGELASAERDLEDALRSADPRVATARPLVTELLAQIASRKDAQWARDRRDCGRSGTAIVCRRR
jgi:tetratricopeptide (TPR) repeat protein